VRSARSRRPPWAALGRAVELAGGVAYVWLASRWSGGSVTLPALALGWAVVLLGLVVLHECAHAAVARAAGLRVTAIVLGSGRRWATLRLGTTEVQVRGLPLHGATHLGTDRPDRVRARFLAAVAAGPATSLALAAAAAMAWPDGHGWGVWRAAVVALGVTAGSSALIPRDAHGHPASDGALLLRALAGHDPGVDLRHALATVLAHRAGPGDLEEAERLTGGLEAGLEHPGLEGTRAMVLLRMGRAPEAVVAYERALGRQEEPAADVAARARLAVARYGAGDLDRGRVELAELLRDHPDHPEVRAALAAVAAVEVAAVRQRWDALAGDESERVRALRAALGAGGPTTAHALAHLRADDAVDDGIARALGGEPVPPEPDVRR
jgi:hypothetical protein